MKRAIVAIFRFYKRRISPLLPSACIYTPTCSEYGIQAVMRFGAVKGLFLTLFRILRCNSFHKGGLDPVPDRRKDLMWLL